MRTLYASFLALTVASGLCAGVLAQSADVPAAERKGFDSLNEAALRSELAYVSSDALLGRMSLQPGDDETARWVAEQFSKAGLKPAAVDANGKPSFMQPFTLVEFRAD